MSARFASRPAFARALRALLFVALAFALFDRARAFEVPRLSGPIVDQARLVNRQDERMLDQLIRRANARGIMQLQILTVPTLNGEPIEQVSIQVTDQWKLGAAEKDNGILLLVARDDRQVRIEVGQGLEGRITDLHSSRIIRDTLVPLFRQNEYSAGIKAGVLQVLRLGDPEFTDQLAEEELSAYREKPRSRKSSILPLIFYVIMIIMSLVSRRFRGFALGFLLGSMGGGRGRMGGGFGGGGGGWSGGGGGFSGGGASGSW